MAIWIDNFASSVCAASLDFFVYDFPAGVGFRIGNTHVCQPTPKHMIAIAGTEPLLHGIIGHGQPRRSRRPNLVHSPKQAIRHVGEAGRIASTQ